MTDAYRILVTGSRTWTDADLLNSVLDDALREWLNRAMVVIVHGDCPKGADAMARAWVRRQPRIDGRFAPVKHEPHPAHWARFGKSAGFRRNAEMVDLGADVCLAFIKDGSKGATHCAGLAEKAGIPVRRFT